MRIQQSLAVWRIDARYSRQRLLIVMLLAAAGSLCSASIFLFGALPSVLFVIALVAVVSALVAPWSSILLIILFAPLTNFASSYFTWGTLPGGAVLRDLVLALALFRWVIGILQHEVSIRPTALSTAFTLAVLVYMAVLGLYVVGAPDKGAALLGARTAGWYMILVLISATVPMDRGHFVSLVYAAEVVGFAMALIGVAEVATNGHALDMLGFRADYAAEGAPDAVPYFWGIRRATGGMGNFIIFGAYMVMHCLITFALLQSVRRRIVRLLLYFSLSVGVVGAILSFTRGAWIMAGVAFVVLAWLGRRRPVRTLMAVLVMCGMAAVVYVAVGDSISARILATDQLTQASNAERMAQFQDVLATAASHPFGLGLGTQGSARGSSANPGKWIISDGFAFQVLAEMGWPMLIAFFILYLWLMRLIWQRHGQLDEGLPRHLTAALLALMCAVFIANFFEGFYDSRLFNMLFWTFGGITIGLSDFGLRTSAFSNGRRRLQ